MDREDPIAQFFHDEENVDLYAVLGLKHDAETESIKKAYRKLALVHHPDKQTGKDESQKAVAVVKFQQIGFAYAVLSDEKRKKRYDSTGQTDEGFELAAGEDGWEAYFEDLFQAVTRAKLDEMKIEYQGSDAEVMDLKKAYVDTNGSIADIMTHIPHSAHDDEARFIVIISQLVESRDLPHFPTWDSSISDEKSRLVREKQSNKEAKEAEEMAKELGVWDEFYGSGKATEPKSKKKGKGKGKAKEDEDEDEDHSALQAIILRKQKNSESLLDNLAAKYAQPARKGKSKRAHPDDDAEPSAKRARPVVMPDIDDAEFEQLQQKLFPSKNAKPKKSKARK